MRLLDLFCGAGGAAVGYHRAGFEVIGVDIRPQPRYPFAFVQADALEFLACARLESFDVIHASPPCQAYSVTAFLNARAYPDLLPAVRAALEAWGGLWIIENVVGAPMHHPLMLCGLMFGLKVFRHRLFDCSELLLAPPHLPHGDRSIGRDGYCCVAGHGDAGRHKRVDPFHRRLSTWSAAMGIDWMRKGEITQAIPPAYTEWIGHELRRLL